MSLTLNEKIEICKAKDSNPRIKNVELATQYGVGKSTIHDILKKSRISLHYNQMTIQQTYAAKDQQSILLLSKH
jgi:hypothetical protein